MANSAQHKISLIRETTYGTTPATPAFKVKEITGTTLALAKGTIESETIRSNRQVHDVRHGNRQIGGDISVELNYDGFADILEAVMCGTWDDTGVSFLVPGSTRRSHSVLRQFTDIVAGGAKPFHLFKGVEFNTFNLTVTPEALVKATFGCMGREVAYADTAPTGATYVDASALKAFDSFTGAILVDGVAVSSVTEIQLNIENGLDPRFVCFDDKTLQPKIGKTRVTGSLGLYFQTSAFLEAFNAATKLALSFTLTDLDGNELTFELPSILGSGGQPDVNGEDDVMITFPFSAIYESGAENPDALKILRVAAE